MTMVTKKQIDADKDPKLLDSAMWEFRRWQAAVAAMQGRAVIESEEGAEAYARDAVKLADALITEYRKTEAKP